MKNQLSSTSERQALWRRLLTEAEQFNRLQPWNWMGGTDIFAVKDAESGEIGYCSVLGEGGELYGMAVYRGEEGLRVLLQTMSGETNNDLKYEQKSLLLSFEDREDLSKEDYAFIKMAGVKFRGRKAWPSFLSFEPGYVRWHLNDHEASFMLRVLEQANIVVERARDDSHFLHSGKNNRILTRSSLIEGDRTIWQDEWMDISQSTSACPISELALSEIQLTALKKKYGQSSMVLECGMFHLPAPIRDSPDERPYFPRVLLLLDRQSGLVIDHDMLEIHNPYEVRVQQLLSNTIVTAGALPARILVNDEQLYASLYRLCEYLGIILEPVRRLPMVEKVKKGMRSQYM